MRLRVITPTEVVLEQDPVEHVTVEDRSGSLGIRPGHAPMVTALVPGLVTARAGRGGERYVAVDGGVMTVSREAVDIVSRRAVAGDSMARLEETVVAGFRRHSEEAQKNRAAFEKLRISFMRGIVDYDRADGR